MQTVQKVETGAPVVHLIAHTPTPYDMSVASARTCYSPVLVRPGEVTQGQRERIGPSIFEAGHHTPFQHPTFVFGLENVSRQFAWAFLHAHPFYNSEQSSQRYNLMPEPKVHVPPAVAADPAARRVFDDAVLAAWAAYHRLYEMLVPDYGRLMQAIGRKKGQTEKQMATDATKKAMENARYVVPIAAFTSMYHTVSGIVLQRYYRMMHAGDCPTETAAVVSRMVEEVKKVDPTFFEMVPNEPLPAERVLEAGSRKQGAGDEAAAAFDKRLDGLSSRLVQYDAQAEALVAESVREVAGAHLSDDEAIDLVVDPRKNPHLVDTVNAWGHSPLMRALNHAQYAFKKKMSHSADSQEQRHRTLPGSRPMLSRMHTRRPDYVTPDVFAEDAEAKRLFDDTMAHLWEAKERLLSMRVPAEQAVYLLPNATSIRYTQSGSFLDYMHKWRLRTCFLAQTEIYQTAYEELAQVGKVHPRLAKHAGPPCVERLGMWDSGGPQGPCPEGSRWCGVDVWRNWPNVKRPF
ncbi:MAG: FAD-dependent thymidylate synthase [Methanobacteriota archaeon]